MITLTIKRFLTLLLFITGTALLAQERGSIEGTITLQDGSPAENITITLKASPYGTITNSRGIYEIKNIAAGNYTLRVAGVGIATVEENIAIANGAATTKNITLKESQQQLDEVIVEAKRNRYAKEETVFVSRIQLKNIENAQVYNVVNKELMKDQVVTSQDDALKNIPGVYQLWSASGRAGDGGSYFASRGFVTQSLVRNGIAGAIIANADAANLERIESIKGPSATLFGSILTSYGGLINRVTKKPYETFGGEVNYINGSYGFNRLSADINTPLNADKSALFRLNASYNSTNTFQDYGTSAGYFVAPSFTYKFSDRLTASVEAEFFSLDATAFHTIYLDWTATPETLGFDSAEDINMDFKRSFYGSDIITKTRSTNIFGQVNYKLSENWNSQSLLTTSTNTSNGPQAWFYLMPGNLMSRNAWKVEGTSNVIEFQQNFNGDFSIGGMRNRFLVGGDIYHVEDETTRTMFASGLFGFDTVDYTAAAPNYYDFNQGAIEDSFENSTSKFNARNNITVYSAYVSDVLNVTSRLLVSAGVRFDSFQNKGNYDPAGNTTSGSFAQNTFSPKFGLVYQIIEERLSVFGNYQNSFKNVVNPNGGTAIPDINTQTFTPERANQVEAGIKASAFSNRLSATLSYYNIKVDDIVRADPANPLSSVQDGSQKSTGFEAEISASPIAGLNILAGYAFNESKLEKATPDVEGLRPVTAGPKNLVNLWASYTLQGTPLKGLGLGFGGNYGSESLIYNYNTVVDGQVTGTQRFRLPQYTVLNASLNYEQPKYRFAVKVNNLTDELYFNGYTTINVQAPRTFMGSVTYKF